MAPDLSKLILNDGIEDQQQLTIDKMATNEHEKIYYNSIIIWIGMGARRS